MELLRRVELQLTARETSSNEQAVPVPQHKMKQIGRCQVVTWGQSRVKAAQLCIIQVLPVMPQTSPAAPANTYLNITETDAFQSLLPMPSKVVLTVTGADWTLFALRYDPTTADTFLYPQSWSSSETYKMRADFEGSHPQRIVTFIAPWHTSPSFWQEDWHILTG